MKIFAIDCSAVSASAAIIDGEKILSYSYTNVGLTHSQTLVPMMNTTLQNAHINLQDIDCFSINAGPGSFTGVRIGISALKGLTAFTDNNCVPVSTLESMAYNYAGVRDCIVCSVMDARCNQVYTACFEISGNTVKRLTEDSAILISELEQQLANYDKDIIFVGDGANLCYNTLKDNIPNCFLASAGLMYQNAVGTAFCAKNYLDNGFNPVSSENILPVYLRVPQAERELMKKSKK